MATRKHGIGNCLIKNKPNFCYYSHINGILFSLEIFAIAGHLHRENEKIMLNIQNCNARNAYNVSSVKSSKLRRHKEACEMPHLFAVSNFSG